jgi:O-glycosyl hydrolase
VSGTPLQVFNDSQAGGSGPTSALTQFARSTAAYIAGFQRFHNVKFYAVSIQNELNFEQFYNSATYPLSSQYLTAVKAVKAEFAKHSELRDIKIMGPEDLLGGDAYGLWEYGGPIHKNLQYLQNIDRDPEASRAVDFFCVHGYAPDGVSSAGSDPRQWTWWANGWTGSPAPGIPSNVKGFKSYGKKSWMTETSGEHPDWIFPKSGFPGQGAFSIAVKIHQALTAGEESAWIYWTFADTDANGNVSDQGLTSQALGANSPKYVAAKHFFKFIRPGARLVKNNLNAPTGVHASSYYSESDRSLVQVIINATASQQSIRIQWPSALSELQAFTSSQGSYWQRSSPSFQNNESVINLPPYSVVTLKAGEMVSKTNQESSDETIRMFFQKNDDQGNVHLILDSDQAGSASLSLYSLQGVRLYTANGLSIQSGWNKIQVPPCLPPHQLVLAQIELNGISLTRKLMF